MKKIIYICSFIQISFLLIHCSSNNPKNSSNPDAPTVTVIEHITLTCTKQNTKNISIFKITKEKEKYHCTNYITNDTETNTELLSQVTDSQEACLKNFNLYKQMLKALGYICTSTEKNKNQVEL